MLKDFWKISHQQQLSHNELERCHLHGETMLRVNKNLGPEVHSCAHVQCLIW